MDLNTLREAAIAATGRALSERYEIVPDEDSDEWEAEYRRQFAALRQRHNVDIRSAALAQPAVAAIPEKQYPELSGTPEEKRWGGQVRAERLGQIPSATLCNFLVETWPRAKQWIDTRDVPTATLLQRLKPRYDEWRARTNERAKARAAEAAAKAAERAAYRKKLADAGVTLDGLVELIDASERTDPAALGPKLADLTLGARHLRIFETSDPGILLVKEKTERGQLPDYGIERDEGLVADLKLYGEAPSA